MAMNRNHPKHKLILTNKKTEYMCDGCKMDGYGERYRCDQCNYDLHKECMNPNKTRTLETLFSGSTFKFMNQPPRSQCGRVCNVCGMDVKGFCYHNKARGLDVHPLCALLKPNIQVDDVEFELREAVVESSGVESSCTWCKEKKLKGTEVKVPGSCYVSRCGEYRFHVYCLMAMGIKYGSKSYEYENEVHDDDDDDDDGNGFGRELVVSEMRMERNINPRTGGRSKFVKVVKVFLKIVLSVLFGDPTAIVASVLVELLPI